MNIKTLLATIGFACAASVSYATPATVVTQDVLYKFIGSGDDSFSFSTLGTSFTATSTTVSFADPAHINGVTVDSHPLLDLFGDKTYWTFTGPITGNNHSVTVDVADGFSDAYKGSVSLTALPVPEPETYAMMLAGLGALGFMARRRQSK